MFSADVMHVSEVNAYLHENIHNFNVELLETVFDVQNAGNLLESYQVAEVFRDIEVQLTVANIKQEPPTHCESEYMFYIDLTESSSEVEDRLSSRGKPNRVKGRRQKQKPKSKDKAKSKPKPRAKRSSDCQKERPSKTLSAKRQPKKRPPRNSDQIILVPTHTRNLSISE